MCNKINLPYHFIIFLFVFVSACGSSLEIDAIETPETIAVATESWTKTPIPTIEPTVTPTITPSPTVLPSPTATLTPTLTPTATPVPPEFSNLTLSLDYDPETFEPLSVQDYFPSGVSYIAVVFEYQVSSLTKLDWHISGADGTIEESGIASLSAREDVKAFIIRPETGLDDGNYELAFELDGEVVLESAFEVYWNPTLWPVMVSEDSSVEYAAKNDGDRFVYGTDFLFAVYPTINFWMDVEIFAEWFVDGDKLGEERYVWDSPEWTSGIHASIIENQSNPAAPLPVGNYELFVYVNGKPKQCKSFAIVEPTTEIDSAEPIPGCETFATEPVNTTPPESWDRYEARTLSELDDLTSEMFFDVTEENVVYIETSPNYQYPSRVQAVFTGDFRETSEIRLEWIKAWMRTVVPDLTAEEVIEIFAQEGLFTADSKEYWLPIQSQLIPIMEDELSPGDTVDLLVVWMGATITSGQVEKIYLVNAFE